MIVYNYTITSMSGRKYYTVIDIETGEFYGRYTAAKSKQAASKAFSKELQRDGLNKNCEYFLYLIEVTVGANRRKIYKFKCKRIMLEHPETFNIGDKVVIYKHRNEIKKKVLNNEEKELIKKWQVDDANID